MTAEFDWGADLDTAAVDVLQLVQRAQDRLPDDPERGIPTVRKFDPNSWPVLRYAISAPGSAVKLRSLVEDVIVPRLEAVNGVGSPLLSAIHRSTVERVEEVVLR